MSDTTLPLGMRDRGRVPNVELLQDRLEERMMVTMLQFFDELLYNPSKLARYLVRDGG